MARPERHDVDYFPFFIKDGKTLFILESKFQCKGTGFFTNVMRFLCATPYHYFQIKDESDRLYFYAKVKCDDISGAEMVKIMSETGKIDKKLWVSASVIVSADLLESIKPAYDKRLNQIMTLDEIRKKFISGAETNDNGIKVGVSGAEIPPKQESPIVSGDFGVDNPQSRVEESRGEKRREEIPENSKITYLNLAIDFHQYQHEKNPTLLRVLNDEMNEQGADELGKLIRIDGYTLEQIQKVLEFVKQDDRPGFNWNKNLLSLASIRQKGKNGNTKFVNILTQIEQGKKTEIIDKSEINNRPPDNWVIDPDWNREHKKGHKTTLYYDPYADPEKMATYPDIDDTAFVYAYCAECDKRFAVSRENLPLQQKMISEMLEKIMLGRK